MSDTRQDLIIAVSVSAASSIGLILCFILFCVCVFRCSKCRKPSTDGPQRTERKDRPNSGFSRDGGSTDQQRRGTLLLPRNMAVQPWLEMPMETRRGLRNNISREAIVCMSPKQRLKAMEVPQAKICLLSEVSESNFGKVYRGEASKLIDSELSTTVLVKSLDEGADDPLCQDFHVEMVWASGFDHHNIIQLLAVCNEVSPRYMIYEYLEFGSLVDFLQSTAQVWLGMDLQSRTSLGSFADATDSKIQLQQQKAIANQEQQMLGNEELVSIGIQIADALDYISRKRIVLKDIGARNCQVGGGMNVKIADFGLSYAIDSEDYCRVGSMDGRPVPLRWLSPEALAHSRYSIYSDIWSFGVLLWEVFSLGDRPYDNLSNAKAAECILRHHILDKPTHCPEAIYDVIKSCWTVQPGERKPFHQIQDELISCLLNRVESGYNKKTGVTKQSKVSDRNPPVRTSTPVTPIT